MSTQLCLECNPCEYASLIVKEASSSNLTEDAPVVWVLLLVAWARPSASVCPHLVPAVHLHPAGASGRPALVFWASQLAHHQAVSACLFLCCWVQLLLVRPACK